MTIGSYVVFQAPFILVKSYANSSLLHSLPAMFKPGRTALKLKQHVNDMGKENGYWLLFACSRQIMIFSKRMV